MHPTLMISSWLKRIARRPSRSQNARSTRGRRAFFEPLEDRRLLATIMVTSLADDTLANLAGDSEISLREAIEAANTNASVDGSTAGSDTEVDTITFADGLTGTITLAGSELVLTESTTINGPGQSLLTIDADHMSRVINVPASAATADVTLAGLTITGGGGVAFGECTLSEDGGGIRFESGGTLAIDGSIVTGNCSDGSGGGIYADTGNVVVTNSTIAANTAARGGGIFAGSGDIQLNNSLIEGNRAAFSSGGIGSSSGIVTVANSTISGNMATNSFAIDAFDGALGSSRGTIILLNSTITGNSATAANGGISSTNTLVAVTIINSIVAGNTAPFAPDLDNFLSPLVIRNSLIGDNEHTSLGESQTANEDGNLIGSSAGAGIIDPILGSLANNGGPTKTHALLPDSPAIDAGASILVTPTGVTSNQTDTFNASNLIDGSGLVDAGGQPTTATVDNLATITHTDASATTAWVTDAIGNVDYFAADPTGQPLPVLTFDLGGLNAVSDIVVWGYHFSDRNNNEAKAFDVQFSTDGGTTFGPAVSVTHKKTSEASETIPLGGVHIADQIRLTFTDNHFGAAGAVGGDRVGLGEVRFLLSKDQRGAGRVIGNSQDIGAYEAAAKFHDDGTFALFVNGPPGFQEPPVPFTHNGGDAMTIPGDLTIPNAQVVEVFDSVVDAQPASFPLTFVDQVASTFGRITYQKADGSTGALGTSFIATAAFRPAVGDFLPIPTVTGADVTTSGSDRYVSTVTGKFGTQMNITSTKTFGDPVIGKTQVDVNVKADVLEQLSLTGTANSDAFRFLTLSSMFADETQFDANMIRYVDPNGMIHELTLDNQTPRDAHLFPARTELGAWFELVKNDGSTWHPDSPTIRVDVADAGGQSLVIQGFQAATTNPNDDSLNVWVERNSTDTTIEPGTFDLSFTITATERAADLAITHTASNTSPAVGEEITLTLTATNSGPFDATNVIIDNPLPAGLMFVSANSQDFDSATGQWSAGTIANGATATLQITARATSAGATTSTAEVFSADQIDPDSTPNNSIATEDDLATIDFNILQADPIITWSNPADITFGTALSESQLNAFFSNPALSAAVLSYTPSLGTVLSAGNDQQLRVDFVTNNRNYNDGFATVTINVSKADPVITWNNPEDITFGTLLDGTQLNAMSDVAGSFSYNPAADTQLNVGVNQQLSVTFTPTDTVNYNEAAANVAINVLQPNLDYGDAPESYPVTLDQNGARHTAGELRLGTLVDVEADGVASSNANADGDDEDGVTVIASMVAASGTPTNSSFAVVASQAGKLDAWIDFDQSGGWEHPGEQIFNSIDLTTGLNILDFAVPAGATPGETVARFRISTAGGLAPTGAAADGEVEDHIATILDGDATGGAAVEIDPPASGTLDVIADGSDVVVRSGAIELFRAPGSSLASVDIMGFDGDDTLNLANLEAIFSGLVGGDAGLGNDTLNLTGGDQILDLTQIADNAVQGLETIDISGSGNNTLTLDNSEVVNLSFTTDTLRVIHDKGDTINYGAGWSAEIPQVVSDQYVHVLTQGDAVVQVVNDRPYENPLDPFDSNRDGSVAPIDVLVVVNKINDDGAIELTAPASTSGLSEFFYYDVNGDRFVAPIDVLLIVNFINDNDNGSGEGEATSEIENVSVPIPAVANLDQLRRHRAAPRRLGPLNVQQRTDHNAALRTANRGPARHATQSTARNHVVARQNATHRFDHSFASQTDIALAELLDSDMTDELLE